MTKGGETQRASPPPGKKSRTAAPSRKPLPYTLVVAMGGKVTIGPAPVETEDFRKIADGNPQLREELKRLLERYSQGELIALAHAISASCKGARRRGPCRLAVPLQAEQEAMFWGARIADWRSYTGMHRKRDEMKRLMAEAIAAVAPLLPRGQREKARRERARRLIEASVKAPPNTTRLPADAARKLWRAQGQSTGMRK